MKRQIYQTARTFRCSNQLAEFIDDLARQSNKHASDFIREAVVRYVNDHLNDPTILNQLR